MSLQYESVLECPLAVEQSARSPLVTQLLTTVPANPLAVRAGQRSNLSTGGRGERPRPPATFADMSPQSPSSPLPTGFALWLAGARPKTLPAAIVPVAVGTAAVALETFILWRAVAAIVVALALQVATNYANDYSDGVRGTDDDRVGPLRLVGSGAASPGAVKKAIFASFGVAAVVGLILSLAVNPWLLVVGLASIAAGWFYTGGSKPYGYLGLGEVFVFVFFGVVATVGSAYVQTETISGLALILSVPVGVFATALLVINNLRDLSLIHI